MKCWFTPKQFCVLFHLLSIIICSSYFKCPERVNGKFNLFLPVVSMLSSWYCSLFREIQSRIELPHPLWLCLFHEFECWWAADSIQNNEIFLWIIDFIPVKKSLTREHKKKQVKGHWQWSALSNWDFLRITKTSIRNRRVPEPVTVDVVLMDFTY